MIATMERHQASAKEADDNGNETAGKRDPSVVGRDNQILRRKKLILTPELRQLPFGFMKTQCTYSDSNFISLNDVEYLKNNTITLEENMGLISDSILVERKYFQDLVDSLLDQVVQLEEKIYLKSIKIENLQLYNSEKLKIINSLTVLLNEAMWKHDMMQTICKEHSPKKLYKTILLASCVSDKMFLLKSNREKLLSCLNNLEGNGPQTLIEVVHQLLSSLDECIGVIEKVTSRELSNALLNEKDLSDTMKNIVCEVRNFQFNVSQLDSNSVVEIIDFSKVTQADENNLENLIEVWEVVKDLFQRNQFLANRVTSLNVHKTGLQLELVDLENNTKELELKTITEIEEVEKKEEILNQNESMIQQHWDEMDTSQEIVVQTQRAQEIDQELQDLQMEYHNHDRGNRRLKTELYHLKNELTEYEIKCEQLETEIKLIENEKYNLLEAYAKSWGHHNEKQKIKYTGKLIKDIDFINQEIKSLELEIEKEEHTINSIVKTPVFSKTQPKAEKTPSRAYGAIDTIKRQNLGLFRESVICNLRYQ